MTEKYNKCLYADSTWHKKNDGMLGLRKEKAPRTGYVQFCGCGWTNSIPASFVKNHNESNCI